mgnify:CR=1 FL=1
MNLIPTLNLTRIWALVFAVTAWGGGVVALADDGKYEAKVIWATNDEKLPDDKKFEPTDPETRAKLESLGLKWKNFYEVKRVKFDAPNGESGKVAISEKSSLSVKELPGKKVEVVFYTKDGKECSRREQTFKRGEMLVHGGNVPENATAWLVTLKKLK